MPPPEPTPENPVEDIELPAHLAGERIVRFEVECRLDTTITVNGNNWFKPGVASKVGWNYLPDEQSIQDAVAYMEGAVISPAIEQQIHHLSMQLAERQKK